MKEISFNERMNRVGAKGPIATAMRAEGGVLHLTLGGTAAVGAVVSVSASAVNALKDLNDEELSQGRFLGGGTALWWPVPNIDISVTNLVEIATGLRSHQEAQRRAGSVKSEAKAAAVRANGAKGGRPRKAAVAPPG